MRNELQAAVEFFKERITAETPIAEGNNLPQGLVDMARHSIKLYTTALAALREKQQREAGCVYCNGETPIADTMDSLQRGSMLIVGGKRLVVDMPTDYISEEICYCPMCGKRLEVWHDAD